MLVAMISLVAAGTASAATLTAHVSSCGGIPSDDSLLTTTTIYTAANGYSVIPTTNYVSYKGGKVTVDEDGVCTWIGRAQATKFTLYFMVKLIGPNGAVSNHTARVYVAACV